jgi:uncharacterized protein involved in tolerance to divalent cations
MLKCKKIEKREENDRMEIEEEGICAELATIKSILVWKNVVTEEEYEKVFKIAKKEVEKIFREDENKM